MPRRQTASDSSAEKDDGRGALADQGDEEQAGAPTGGAGLSTSKPSLIPMPAVQHSLAAAEVLGQLQTCLLRTLVTSLRRISPSSVDGCDLSAAQHQRLHHTSFNTCCTEGCRVVFCGSVMGRAILHDTYRHRYLLACPMALCGVPRPKARRQSPAKSQSRAACHPDVQEMPP